MKESNKDHKFTNTHSGEVVEDCFFSRDNEIYRNAERYSRYLHVVSGKSEETTLLLGRITCGVTADFESLKDQIAKTDMSLNQKSVHF